MRNLVIYFFTDEMVFTNNCFHLEVYKCNYCAEPYPVARLRHKEYMWDCGSGTGSVCA